MTVREAWKGASRELFAQLARDAGLGHGPKGIVLRGPDSWAAVASLPSTASTAAELLLSFELRVWVRWVSEFEAWAWSGWPPFPPTRVWQQRAESWAYGTRWDDPELFPGRRVPQFASVRDEHDVAALVALLRVKLVDLRPRLETVADPRWLLDRWTARLDRRDPWPPDIAALRSAAVTAHGVGDDVLRDRVLDVLDTDPDGRRFVHSVRDWMRQRAGSS